MIDKMREQFQYWLDHGDYARSEMTDGEREIAIILAIADWQASRACFEVELPESPQELKSREIHNG